MAHFGVTSALVSIVLSVFMAGLGLGSWGSGRMIRKYRDRLRIPALRLYALTELLIGLSALIVPYQIAVGTEPAGAHRPVLFLDLLSGFRALAGAHIGSLVYLYGATIPIAMLAIKNDRRAESSRSFSFLYLSNVLGAVAGATLPLLFRLAFTEP